MRPLSRNACATIRLVGIALLVTVFASCSSGSQSVLTGGTFELRYDGDNDNSPNLAGNTTYEAAVRFTATEIADLAGGTLTQVRFYIETVPDNCKIKLYAQGTANEPGALIYEADVSAGLVGAAWNTHLLAAQVVVPSNDLWVSVEFTDAAMQRTIGCDPGPAVTDGNWLYNFSGSGSWDPFFVSVNWNIRAVVET